MERWCGLTSQSQNYWLQVTPSQYEALPTTTFTYSQELPLKVICYLNVYILTSRTPEYDLFWREGLYRGTQVKMRSLGERGLNPVWLVSLQKWEIWMQRHTWKEDDVNRHRWKTVFYRPRKEAWTRSFSHSPQKEPPCQALGIGPLVSTTVWQWLSVVYATQSVVLCYGSHRFWH